MKLRNILGIVVVVMFASTTLFGQQARNGTSAAPQLMIPLGAQYLSGGGAAAHADGVEGIVWNPAGLDRQDYTAQAIFSRRNYLADIGINYVGVGLQLGGFGSLGATLRSFDIGEIPITDEFHMDGTGGTFQPTFFVFGLTYSKQMADRIRVGLTTNLINEDIGNASAAGFTMDAGVQYSNFLNIPGMQIGVALRNIGTSMKYDGPGLYREADDIGEGRGVTQYKVETTEADMPTVIDIAVSYVPITNLNVGVTFTENNYAANDYRFFGSYDLGEYGTLRGAYLISEQQEELENIFAGPQAGATLNLAPIIGTDISLDYAFMPVKYFSANHLYSIRVTF